MSPPQESAPYRQSTLYTSEHKRMRLSTTARLSGSSTTTRQSTGAPTAMTNKGSVYKAQRGKAVTAAAVKAKAPTTHRRRGRKGKSVYRGVCVTREGKWRAVIYKERKQLYLGVYESEVDAAKAHDRAARYHFAENAVCNFDSEDEADRQVLLHKQREMLQQQQLAEDRAHAQFHGGSFSVGREEFDDLEEYHRGLEEASTSEGEEGDGYDACSRSTRSLSTSSSMESMTDESPRRENFPTTYEPVFVCENDVKDKYTVGNGSGDGEMQNNRENDSDVAVPTALVCDLEPTPLEGMGFPLAEDLLGYEMQSWCGCHEDDTVSPSSSTFSSSSVEGSMLPLASVRTSDPGAGMGSNGWTFGDFGSESYGSSSCSSSSRASSSSFSGDDEFAPSALPPLMMGMYADP